jgi:hypothetical protein
MRHTLRRTALACSIAALATLARAQEAPGAPPQPAAPGIRVELNKLEAAGSACRGYFVITNGAPDALKDLRLDVFLFDKAGIVLRRVGLTFTDVRAERSKVVLFDIPDTACADVGRLVVNDVLACNGSAGTPLAGCPNLIATSTRAGAAFTY